MLCPDPHEKATVEEQQQCESFEPDSERATWIDTKCVAISETHFQSQGFEQNVKVFT